MHSEHRPDDGIRTRWRCGHGNFDRRSYEDQANAMILERHREVEREMCIC